MWGKVQVLLTSNILQVIINMMKNVVKVAQSKTKELRPRRKNWRRFGAQGVGLRESSVSSYEV